MKTFVIDTNIIFSALAKDSITRRILIDCPFDLYAPETLITEIRKHESLILEKSSLSKEEFEVLFTLVTEKITIISKEDYETFIPEARLLIPEDETDAPFIALALAISNDGIWSDDKDFQNQKTIKVWTTLEVINSIG
jgi:predicted nucleic acid-binding protein